MGRVCCVNSCRKSSKNYPQLRYFKIPAVINNQCDNTKLLSQERRDLWLKALSLSPDTVKNHRVCSMHFNFGSPSKLFEKTSPDWVPNKFLGASVMTSTPISRRKELRQISAADEQLDSLDVDSGILSFSMTSMENDGAESEELTIHPCTDNSDTGMYSGENCGINSYSSNQSDNVCSENLEIIECLEIQKSVTNQNIQTENLGIHKEIQSEKIGTNQCIQTEKCGCTNQEIQTDKVGVDEAIQTDKVGVDEAIQTEKLGVTQETQTEIVETHSMETQTMFRISYKFELEGAEFEIQKLKTELNKLSLKLEEAHKEIESVKGRLSSEKIKLNIMEVNLKKKSFYEETFDGDDDRVTFFSGLESFPYLLAIFRQVEPYLFKRSKLTEFQQYVLTLMKLRLALSNRHLSYIYDVSEATVGRIFYNSLNALYRRLSRCIHWPERENLQATMPRCFREHFGTKVAVIIDCFEVFTEKPSSVLSRAETWSNYKHNNTVKFLIGITPQGTINFISKGWGGRVSDQMLTINSGILKKLLPGDVILADRGFDIAEEVGFYCASLKIPAFTKNKTQLDPYDVEETRKLANVRIHVERVIGCMRQKFAILHTKIPIELLDSVPEEEISTVDKIAIVACSLTNLCSSVVPLD